LRHGVGYKEWCLKRVKASKICDQRRNTTESVEVMYGWRIRLALKNVKNDFEKKRQWAAQNHCIGSKQKRTTPGGLKLHAFKK
jgi:hypothetical protein